MYGDGTGTGGKVLGGLGLLVSGESRVAVTVGGINRATYTFWRSQQVSGAHDRRAVRQPAGVDAASSTTTAQQRRQRRAPDKFAVTTHDRVRGLRSDADVKNERYIRESKSDKGISRVQVRLVDVQGHPRWPTTSRALPGLLYMLNTDEPEARVPERVTG